MNYTLQEPNTPNYLLQIKYFRDSRLSKEQPSSMYSQIGEQAF